MKFLFVAISSPLPANNGQRMRIWALLRALHAEGHETDLLALGDADEFDAHKREFLEVCRTAKCVPLKLEQWAQHSSYARRLAGLLSSVPFGVERFRSAEMRDAIQSATASRGYNAIIAMPYGLVNVPDDVPVPIIVDDQNVEHMILRRYVDTVSNPAVRAYAWLEWIKFRRWESSNCARGKMVWVCSDIDREAMADMAPRTAARVVPNIVDVQTYEPHTAGEEGRLLYIGGLDWLPNRDAVSFFIEQIAPELRKLNANFHFVAAFSPEHRPPDEYRQKYASEPSIELLETKSIRDELAKASIMVVPIRIGSGTRFKILEAASSAKPVVSTRVGAEGLNFVDGEDIALRDKPEEFAKAVAELLPNRGARERMGSAARARAEGEYSFEALRASLRRTLAEFSGERGREARLDTAGAVRS